MYPISHSQNTWASFLKSILGACLCLLFVAFIILTSPVYILRLVVSLLAKHFGKDLGTIFEGQSGFLASDYLSATTPRSNIVYKMIFEGHITTDDVKRRVLKNWISVGENAKKCKTFEKFQQYPVTWLGFPFWKWPIQPFSVDKHVQKLHGADTTVTEETVQDIMENILNASFPSGQSPWRLYVIENYTKPSLSTRFCTESTVTPVLNNGQQHSALIFACHHCLADGYGIISSICEGLSQQQGLMQIPKCSKPNKKQSFLNPWKASNFAIQCFSELSMYFSHLFTASLWKVSDEEKKNYQVYAVSQKVPVRIIKDIKNAYNVTFSSVGLSAISAAVSNFISQEMGKEALEKKTNCFNILPSIISKSRNILENHFSAAVMELPTRENMSSEERLRNVNLMLERERNSTFTIMIQSFMTLVGGHLYAANKWLSKNKFLSIAISNVRGLQSAVKIASDITWTDADIVAGCLNGDTGLGFGLYTHNQQVSIIICAEKAVLTRYKAKRLLELVIDEIENLSLLSKRKVV